MRRFGFSLIELLIVLTIIGILITLSMPLYSHYVARTNRAAAEIALMKLATALEEYHIIHHTYENATLNTLHFPNDIANHQYQLSITSASAMQYSIAAIPAKIDERCGTLTLNDQGEKGITGQGQLSDCW